MSIWYLTNNGIPSNTIVHGSELHSPVISVTSAADAVLYSLPSVVPPSANQVMEFQTDGSSSFVAATSLGSPDALVNSTVGNMTANKVVIAGGSSHTAVHASSDLSVDDVTHLVNVSLDLDVGRQLAVKNGAYEARLNVDGSNILQFTNCVSYNFDDDVAVNGIALASQTDVASLQVSRTADELNITSLLASRITDEANIATNTSNIATNTSNIASNAAAVLLRQVISAGATGARPGAPVAGQIFYDTTVSKLIVYDGVGWVDTAGGAP